MWLLPLLALLSLPAWGMANLGFSPLRLDMRADAPVTQLSVVNQGDRPVLTQVSVKRWQQPAGEDALEDDDRLVVTPALFRLAPGKRQIVRIGWPRGATVTAAEQAWRVLIEEVPLPGDRPASGLSLSLRISLPLFLAGTATAEQALRWQWQPASDGQPPRLLVRNAGNQHARITRIQLAGDSEASATLLYVLPGATRPVALDKLPDAMPASLSITDDSGEHRHPLHAMQP